MSNLIHRLEAHARQREARGASEEELNLYRDAMNELRLRQLPRAAGLETLAIIQAHPGINQIAIAERRGVTSMAAIKVVLRLERLGLIRTQKQGRNRACYPVGGQDAPRH